MKPIISNYWVQRKLAFLTFPDMAKDTIYLLTNNPSANAIITNVQEPNMPRQTKTEKIVAELQQQIKHVLDTNDRLLAENSRLVAKFEQFKKPIITESPSRFNWHIVNGTLYPTTFPWSKCTTDYWIDSEGNLNLINSMPSLRIKNILNVLPRRFGAHWYRHVCVPELVRVLVGRGDI